MQEGYTRTTIYNNIKRCMESKDIKQQYKGFQSKVWNDKNRGILKRAAKNKVGVSLRKLLGKFSLSHITIIRRLFQADVQFKAREKKP